MVGLAGSGVFVVSCTILYLPLYDTVQGLNCPWLAPGVFAVGVAILCTEFLLKYVRTGDGWGSSSEACAKVRSSETATSLGNRRFRFTKSP